MARLLLPLVFLLIVCSLRSQHCRAQRKRETVVTSFNYNKRKNQTTYLVFPYGTLTLAGKWKKLDYEPVALQQRMMSADSIRIGVTFGSCTSFEFNTDAALQGPDFTAAFYKWESDYLRSRGVQVKILEQDTAANYILWQASRIVKGVPSDTYFLISERGCHVRNIALYAAPEFTAAQKVSFLKSLLGPAAQE